MTTTRPKGHWPKGKPRHPRVPPARLERVRRFFDQHRLGGGPIVNERSAQRVALAIGVSPRTVRRWLAGEDNPSPEQWRDLIAQLETLGW